MMLGRLNIEKPLFLAPMEDVTDLPFRIICRRLGVDAVVTEFINAEGLSRENDKTMAKMHIEEEERPVGIQIYGAADAAMARAASMADALNPDFIDINAGCWVRDVALRGAGAGLLRDLDRMESIVKTVINATKLPVTVKTRLGWDSTSINIVDVAKMVEQAGAKALFLHCRTRAQGHAGETDFTWIPKIKQVVAIPVIANGNITSPRGAKELLDATGCDGLMIGRGAMGNPWLFRHIRRYLETGIEESAPSIDERVDVILDHLRLSAETKGERRAVIEFRKHYAGYFRGIPNHTKVRLELMAFETIPPIEEILRRFAEQRLAVAN
jgi:tRNA-dihydrouridine synthase B